MVGRHDGPTVPVRVGVPPSKELAEAWLTISRMPATTFTFPFMPFGNFGVFTGSATSWLPVDVW